MMSDNYEVQIKTIEAHLRRLGLTEEQILLHLTPKKKGNRPRSREELQCSPLGSGLVPRAIRVCGQLRPEPDRFVGLAGPHRPGSQGAWFSCSVIAGQRLGNSGIAGVVEAVDIGQNLSVRVHDFVSGV